MRAEVAKLRRFVGRSEGEGVRGSASFVSRDSFNVLFNKEEFDMQNYEEQIFEN